MAFIIVRSVLAMNYLQKLMGTKWSLVDIQKYISKSFSRKKEKMHALYHNFVLFRALPREAFIYLVHAFLLILFSVSFASIQTVCRILVTCNPSLYWIAALTTTPLGQESVPINRENLDEFPIGKNSEKISVMVEDSKNLYNPISTLVLTENSNTELSSWTKIYFLGYLTLGTMIFAGNFPGL